MTSGELHPGDRVRYRNGSVVTVKRITELGTLVIVEDDEGRTWRATPYFLEPVEPAA